MLRMLHERGVRAEHCYTAGLVSIGAAFLTWVLSKTGDQTRTERTGSWGIFIGEWAPTFIALGNGLRTYEKGTQPASVVGSPDLSRVSMRG